MKKTKLTRSLLAACSVIALTAVMYGCTHDGGSDEPPQVVDPMPTAYETALAAINAAGTAAAAQAAYDAVDQAEVSGDEDRKLQAALSSRLETFATMNRETAQKAALMTAAGNIDTSDLSTAEAIAAANTAIAALQMALDAAADVSDADKEMYRTRLTNARTAVSAAQGDLDTEGRMTAQRAAIDGAVSMAQTAVAGVTDDSTDAEVTAADTAIQAVKDAIAAAADLSADDATIVRAQGVLEGIEPRLAAAKVSRQNAMDDADEETRMNAIEAAEKLLGEKEAALEALADDATDEAKRDAHRMIEAAANALRDTLRMNGGSDADIEAAIRRSAEAKVAADALQATITKAAEAEDERQMNAISAAEDTLTKAEEALAELGEDATDKETRDAHRAVERAAANLIQVLEANEGTADQIEAAEMKRDSAKMMADDLTSPIEIAEQREAITDALADLATKVAAVDDDSSDAEVKAADDAIATARKAIEDATELPKTETDAHSAVVNAHASILGTAKKSRQAVLDGKADEVRDAAREAANKVADTKKTAMGTEADTATTAARPFDLTTAPSDPTAPAATENYVVTVEYDGGPKVTVKDGALPADNDPMYEQVATFGNGQMLVRNIGTERMIIVLHSDIEAPDQKAFSTQYSFTVDRDTDTTAMDTYEVLAADNEKIASSSFPSGASLTKAFPEYTETATAEDKAKAQFSGTFDGASGTYRCVANGGCSVVTDGDGDFNALTAGEWQFTPAAGATVAVADDDYMTYGFWLDTTTKDGEITSYDTVQTFATSSLTASTGLGSVTGTAAYEGDAAGVYVHETKNEDGTLDVATSGRFTADVALKAYFTDPASLRAAGTIEGTISEFDLDGGPDNSWTVNVSATGIATSDAGFTGNASGMTGDNGSLSGSFYGSGDAATDAPPVLIGEFNSNFVNGRVAGAYGARKDDD